MECFDCEVFAKDWMFVFINIDDPNKREIIVNDPDRLRAFYESHREKIFVGYNSRSYDQYIFKAILCGIDPKKINDYIIQGGKGAFFSVKLKDIKLLVYDCMVDKTKSLKQLEAFMGNDIRETSVDFNLNRKLTAEEIELTKRYCTHDVEQTIEVFKRQPEEFESQKSLVEAFNLPKTYMTKTKAQLSAIILEAQYIGDRFDEFEIRFPDTLKISDRYQYIYDWYKNPLNRNYEMSLKTRVYGVPHIFAWGGIHGAIPNYIGEGFYVMSDVASLYPSIMIEYGFLSRNVPDIKKFVEIRDRRLVLKKAKNPMQLPYKIVINSTFGAMKDRYNQLYDPLMANCVCVAGQLLLLDLIDKVEQHFGDKCQLIQSNTDGILVKLPDESCYEEYLAVCKEWETRTRLSLEHDIYSKVYQKDVNNYVIVKPDGVYKKPSDQWKTKGAYVKKLKDLDYDLPVVNKALIECLVHGTPIETYIENCNLLKEYQKIIKIGKDYAYGMHGDKPLSERVLRVFASSNPQSPGIFKYRNGEVAKVGNTPDHAIIINDNVNGLGVDDRIDKSWYINLAKKRYDDFMKPGAASELPDISDYDFSGCRDFTEVIQKTFSETSCKPKAFKTRILLNCFYEYGSIKKLLRWYELYRTIYGKKGIQKEKLEKLGIDIELAAQFGHNAPKSITKLDSERFFAYLIEHLPDDEFSLNEITERQFLEFDSISYVNPCLHSGYCAVSDLTMERNVITFTLRSFKEGKRAKFKLSNGRLDTCGLHNGQVIKIGKTRKEYQQKFMGYDEQRRPIIREYKDFPIYELLTWHNTENVSITPMAV